MIRLIVTDVDGTLLSDGKTNICEDYFEVIKNLIKKGIYFGVSSGRQYHSICQLFAPIKDEIIYICENGAFIKFKDQEISCTPMTKKDSEQLVIDTRSIPDAESLYCTKYIAYCEKKDMNVYQLMSTNYKFKCSMVDDLLKIDEPCLKYSLYLPDHVEEITSKKFIPKWSRTHKVACGGRYFMDVMDMNVDKGEALKKVQSLLKVSKNETMAFGDNINDLEMLNAAGFNFAIGNARKEVKDAAGFIADTVEHNGVLKVLSAISQNIFSPLCYLKY